jgi:thioredoxin reductase/bacterioferritin-associated ferredoxin
MTSAYDVIVLGAGPAGAAAAVRARELGLSVAVVDEGPVAGGQVYRAPSPATVPSGRDPARDKGDALRRRLAASGAAIHAGQRVWSISGGFTVNAIGTEGPQTLEAPNVIVAAGAIERHIPVLGWTLPGVIGLAAATVLIKSHGVLPGQRVLVAGSGPLLLLVASKIIASGGTVVAVVDAAPRTAWLSTIPKLLSRPDLAAKGLSWAARLLAAGVPIHSASAIRLIEGVDSVRSAEIGSVGSDWRPVGPATARYDVDAVCLGFGLLPSTDVTRVLGAAHRFEPALGGWVPSVDDQLQTSVPGLFVAGDCAGVRGADAAPLSGELAAVGVARRGGRVGKADRDAGHAAARWRRSGAFGEAMSAVAMPPPGAVGLIDPNTTVCRCEGLTRSVLDEAIAAGSRTLADLKAATRCGMGPCGGRICGEATAMLLAEATGADRQDIGQASARPPLRPVPIAAIAGDFNYDDLPIPAPAPL